MSNGVKYLLFQAFRSEPDLSDISRGESVFSYSAKYFVSDFSNFENIIEGFDCVTFAISGILGWGGKSAYKIDENYGVINNTVNKILLFKNYDFEINYYVSGTSLPVHDSQLFSDDIQLSQYSHIEIKCTTKKPLENFFELFDKIKLLIELATIEKLTINNIKCYSDLEYMLFNDGKKIPRVLNILSPIINNRKVEHNYYGMSKLRIFTLDDLLENDSFEVYFSNFEKIKPIIELYIEILYLKDISSVRLFLNVVQALETYHSRFKSNDIDDFKNRIKTLYKTRNDKTENFLMANSNKFITLESRIADLLLAESQIYFDTGEIKHLDFPKVIAKTRNYYIHYDEKIKEDNKVLSLKELSIYNSCLLILLDYYIYSELGFNDHQELIKKLKYRWGDVRNLISQQNAFKNRIQSKINEVEGGENY
ncbi:HEPN domain-containing protein [Streptococcus halichoeri]|uniref:HEPN domain-containing protein n=1 Tax=Streptococcus halichoeri TaxID=254785 RepID=UPI001F3E7AD6|nr:HEPN domain-containing protein [Streptococcus halichoeri]